MDFSKLAKDDLGEFLAEDYSEYGLPSSQDLAQQIYEQLIEVNGPISIPVQDLYLATNYTGPGNVKYTEHDILHMDQEKVDQFQQLFGFSPTDLNTDRNRILRILTYLDLIYDQSKSILEPSLLQSLCSTLSLKELNHIREAYHLDELDCIVNVIDRDGIISQVLGLNDLSYGMIYTIREVGSIEAFYSYIQGDDLEAVKWFVEKSNGRILELQQDRKPYLIHALQNGANNVAKYLIDQGVNLEDEINVHNFRTDLTPLIATAGNGDLDMVKYLVEHGANINHSIQNTHFHSHESPLSVAISYIQTYPEKGVDMVTYLVQEGADVNFNPDNRMSLLSHIIVKRNVSTEDKFNLVKLFIEHGAKLNDPDIQQSPLQTAILAGDFELIDYLIQHGADVDFISGYELAPLLVAMSNNLTKESRLKMVKLLIEHGADPHLGSPSGSPPIFEAIKKNEVEIVEYLLQLDNFNLLQSDDLDYERNENEETVLNELVSITSPEHDFSRAIQMVIDMGEDLNRTDTSPLELVLYNDHEDTDYMFEIINILLNGGADPNLIGDNGLHLLITQYAKLLIYLIDNGLDVLQTSVYGHTLLWYTVMDYIKHRSKDLLDLIRVLLNAGADPDNKDEIDGASLNDVLMKNRGVDVESLIRE